MAVEAKPKKLKKEFIAHMGICKMVDVLDGLVSASCANTVLAIPNLFPKPPPLIGAKVF